MIDLLFYGILLLALVIMIWLGKKEEISPLMMFAGVLAVLIGAMSLTGGGIGTEMTTTTNSTVGTYNDATQTCVNCTTTTTAIQTYSLPADLVTYLSIFLMLLGLYILIDEIVGVIQQGVWRRK